MSNLLARFAGNAFWLGRYLERAESLARIIDINETYARETRDGSDWLRVLDLYADRTRFHAGNDRVTPEAVLEFYVLDAGNPTSIRAAVQQARENARTLRHLISTEMWTHLNVFHHRIASLTRRDIWRSNLANLCSEVKIGCQTFEGIAEGTFFRDEAWRFYQIGKYLERADQTTRVLDIGYDRLSGDAGDSLSAMHRDVLVRSVAGYHAFRGRYPTSAKPADIALFLIYDDKFPRAVELCISRMIGHLRDLEQVHGRRAGGAVEKACRSLEFALETGIDHRITSRRIHKYLDDLQVAFGLVANAIAETYFK